MIEVKLQPCQKVLAHYEGLDRHKGYIQRQTQNTQHIHKTKGVTYEQNLARQVLAVGAEIAVANYFGIGYIAYSYPVADVGKNVEVRYSPSSADLVIRPHDKNEQYAVLVYGNLEGFTLVGYMQVGEAKTYDYTEHQACWWIKPGDLNSIQDLQMQGDKAYERLYSL